ncbi:unnamed protein product [Chrysoparadoxa australica]
MTKIRMLCSLLFCILVSGSSRALSLQLQGLQSFQGGIGAVKQPTRCVLQRGTLGEAPAAVIHRAQSAQSVRRRRGLAMKLQVPKPTSSEDWFQNITKLGDSRLLKQVSNQIVFFTTWALALSCLHAYTPQHFIDDYHVSTAPHSITAGALGLLLVFRSNAGYDRFWEGRKIWGSITNTCRNIALLAKTQLDTEKGVVGNSELERHYQTFLQYLMIFPYMLKQHLQADRNDIELAWSTLSWAEQERVHTHPNPPLYTCQRMREELEVLYSERDPSDPSSIWGRLELERGITLLIDFLGMCERIVITPVPRSYSRHTSRFLSMYLFTLPIVLVPHTEFFTIPITAAVAWGLLGIEALAYFIETPFDKEKANLPLKPMCDKIRIDIERMGTQASVNGSFEPYTYLDPSRPRIKQVIDLGGSTGDAGRLSNQQLHHPDRGIGIMEAFHAKHPTSVRRD